ncbi:MAG: DUF2339 domain-containing protein [Planctomycetales bacterium]|nr:DUF2339 domain-containing protein [Planctomycetales bacterium]
MEGFFALLILLGIGLVIAGPVAVILSIVLFNKLGDIQRRLNKLEGKTEYGVYGVERPKPVTYERKEPVWSGQAAAFKPAVPQTEAPVPPVEIRPFQPEKLMQEKPAGPTPSLVDIQQKERRPGIVDQAPKPQSVPPTPPQSPVWPPSREIAAAVETVKQKTEAVRKMGWELKIGTTIALVVGAILVIAGVGFFLKYVYEQAYLGPAARVLMVAFGGLAAIVIGEVTRRRGYEIVAKGVAALGFALLYAAVFSGSRVYQLFSVECAFGLSMVVTAAAMTYAVVLNEVFIAFLSLLGGYLSPAIISTGQNLPIPLFSYILVLSAGALGCAMFRRWRAVNWIAMAGTYLLYAAWFEKFYTTEQLPTGLFWLSVFGGIYLLQPVLYGLVQKITARKEDVVLVVVNSIAVFFYLWQMLHAGYRRELALAVGALGAVHLILIMFVTIRCREDDGLQAALGVLGSVLIAAAIPLYFAAVQPSLVGWSVEAVALTFVGIRYKSLWTKGMAVLVAAVASAGLFYHLPLHPDGNFRLIFNAPFGTWLWVSLSIIVCHALWRFMLSAKDEEGALLAQVYFVWGRLLFAVGLALEWDAHCDWHIEYLKQGQAYFLMGLMVIAALLFIGFLVRPLCPKGDFVRTVGAMTAAAGSIFVVMAMKGVYYYPFKLFVNVPFAIAAAFTAILFFGAWRVHRTVGDSPPQRQIPGAMVVMGLILIFILLSEQMYSYWYCRNEYGVGRVAGWNTLAHQSMFISWAVYGLVILAGGIRFDKMAVKGLGMLAAGLSAAGLFLHVPLHNNSDFQFVVNMPFITWICVAVAILMGHALWRLMRPTKENENMLAAQIYYTAGGLLLALGCVLEWYAHCRWQIPQPYPGRANFMLGCIIICIVFVSTFLARPLPPKGLLVKTVGLLAALGGAIYTGYVMTQDVYYQAFKLFVNVPFGVAMLYAAMLPLAGWYLRRLDKNARKPSKVPSLLVLAGLILIWALLSEQIYQFWYCGHAYGSIGDNWRFLAQMYISVSWAIYAAILLVIGFALRTRGIRYLSLVIFAVLLAKINLDLWTLGTEYRIATFLTTGLILVGVSFLYQFLKKKGFFETLENKKIESAEIR